MRDICTCGGEKRSMEGKEIFEKLARAVIEGDEEKCKEYAREVLRDKVDPLKAVEQGLSKGMISLGERFERGEVFLPDLLIAADAFNVAIEVLRPAMEAQKKQIAKLGTVLIGTVNGDVHGIGKNIVAVVLGAYGFEVVDMGVDNPSLKFIQEAEKVKADLIGLSSLMTTTMPAQREVIEILKEMHLREKYMVMVGGGPVTQEWADRIGADGYAGSAFQAVEVVKRLLSQKKIQIEKS
jgi:corrinoid protein of di/trimethylamine methyltransferase